MICDRPSSRGHGEECLGPKPRTQAQVLIKIKGLQKIFLGDLKKKVFKNRDVSSNRFKKLFKINCESKYEKK